MNLAQYLGLLLNLPDEQGTAIAGRSKRAMAVAADKAPYTFSYRRPINMKDATTVQALVHETAGKITVPSDDGQYYLAFVRTAPSRKQIPVLVAEGEVVQFVRMHYALTQADSLQLLQYTGPVNPRDPMSARKLRAAFGAGVVEPPAGPYRYLVSVNDHPVLLDPTQVLTFICDQWALTRSHDLGVFTYERPYDLITKPAAANALPPDIITGSRPTTGVHYHLTLPAAADGDVNELVGLGEAPAFARGYALGSRHEAADSLAYTTG